MLNKPILIAGAPRSGTSMCARILTSQGVWTGDCRQPNKFNPYGYYENITLTNMLDQHYKGHFPLAWEDILEVLEFQAWPPQMPWLFKHWKLLPTWKIWDAMFPEATWVLPFRKEEDNLRSMTNMRYANPYAVFKECQMRQNEIADNCTHRFVDTQKVVEGWVSEQQNLICLPQIAEPSIQKARDKIDLVIWNRKGLVKSD
tara:strand:+ start:1657 stop:2259 length:603 start_codon:yes stop_codon:yes gene_type:complete